MNHIYEIITTVDITPTGIISAKYKNIQDYELKRNQQRNFDTLIQVLSLRTNVQEPQIDENIIYNQSWLFGNKNLPDVFKTWTLTFSCDRDQVFGEDNQALYDDLHMIPIIPALTETVPTFPPYFLTHGNLKNVYII